MSLSIPGFPRTNSTSSPRQLSSEDRSALPREVLQARAAARELASPRHALFRPAGPFTVRLGEGDERTSLALVGGKAISLDRMIRSSCEEPEEPLACVPEGICVTTLAYEQFILDLGLAPKIQAIFSPGQPRSREEQEEALARIRERILEGDLPREARDGIQNFLESLSPGVLECRTCAVRSSSTMEDTVAHSFAGLYESFLNVPPRLEEIGKAVKECWASLFQPRILAYRSSSEGQTAWPEPRMGVIIQLQLSPRSSGVLFTLDPQTSHPSHFFLESAWGLGEAVVSGRVSPHRFVIDWTKLLRRDSSEQAIIREECPEQLRKCVLRRGEDEKEQDDEGDEGMTRYIRWTSTTPEERSQSSLTREQVLRLAALGLEISQHHGRPCDIEWAIEEDQRIYLLQARPITATSVQTDTDYGIADFGCPSVLSRHLSALSYARMMQRILALTRRRAASPEDDPRLFFGDTPYLRSELWTEYVACDWSLLGPDSGAIRALFLPDLETLRAEFLERLPRNQELEKCLRESFQADPVGFLGHTLSTLDWELEVGLQSYLVGGAVEYFENLVEAYVRDVNGVSQGQRLDLRRLVHGVNFESEATRSSEILSRLAKAVSRHHGLRRRFEQQQSKQGEPRPSSPEFLGQLQGVQEAGSLLEAFQAFCDRFFYMSGGGEDITFVRFREDPSTPWSLLVAHILSVPAAPEDDAEAAEAELLEVAEEQRATLPRSPEIRSLETQVYLEELQRGEEAVEKVLPGQGRSFAKAVRALRGFLGWKEAVHLYSSVNLYFLRLWLTEILRQLGLLSDGQPPGTNHALWALNEGQLREFLNATQNVWADSEEGRKRVTEGIRATLERQSILVRMYRDFPAPSCISGGKQRCDTAQSPSGPLLSGGDGGKIIQGVPCSGGRVTGRVCVMQSLEDPASVQPGDILVAETTNPSWSPLFGLLGGMITEHGGVLSHVSLVARESEIPLVTQIPDACQILKTGDRVEMDGSTGEVRLIRP